MPTAAPVDATGTAARSAPDAAQRAAWRSRLATVGLVVVLVGISGYALWSSQATSIAAAAAVSASRVSDDYVAAARAVAAEESLERKYRLEPGPAVQTRFEAAATDLVAALTMVGRHGDATDRTRVAGVLAAHAGYLTAADRMFRAVDRGDAATALRIDGQEIDPPFAAMQKTVVDAATASHLTSTADLAHLQDLEKTTSRSTPLVFLVGLILVTALAAISRGYPRLLVIERAKAVHESLHDSLTGLPNRTLLADRLAQALRSGRRNDTTTALLLIDLDRFKEINDTFGHNYGDLLLIQIGPRLVAALRDVDTVARLGGDEFAVLLPDVTDLASATQIARKLRSALEVSFQVEGVELDVEASVGIVLSGQEGEDASLLLQRVDIAMYVAKAQNLGVFAYDHAADRHSPAKLALLGDLRRALQRDELVLYYQPKIGIATGELVGAEALVRWQHPGRGLMQPDEFIPLAEHTGLIGPLTRHVLDVALRQARIWQDAGWSFRLAVNLSARNLLDERLPRIVTQLLARHAVPAHLLTLEVTESALMTEPGRAQRLLEQLVATGVSISIDDFGAGYTSLGQLKDLPVGELKIDRSFITAMTADRSNELIVHSVIDLGHSLGLTIVAEGVETAGALATLAGFGCDVAQGYYLSRPLSVPAFESKYGSRAAQPAQPAQPGLPVGRWHPT